MRKYKLDDSLIFKPDKLQLTPEEELEAERNFELFCAMMEKNGVACLSDPSYEITREQIDEEIRSGKVFVGDYNDSTGKATFYDFYRGLRGKDYDET